MSERTVTIGGGKWTYRCSMGQKRDYYKAMDATLADEKGVFASRYEQCEVMLGFVEGTVEKVVGLKDKSGKPYKTARAAAEAMDEVDVALLVGAIINNQEDESGNAASGSALPPEVTSVGTQ